VAVRALLATVVRFFGSGVVLRRLALGSLVANVVIVVTGGAVRLTGSGLGCPTWPECDGKSYVTTRAMGYHGVIEFTNRTLTGVVGTLAALCVIAAWCQRDAFMRHQRAWAIAVLAGIPAQAVLGGLTVLTKLNPWLVAGHFLLSIAVLAAAYQLWIRTAGVRVTGGGKPALRALTWTIVAVTGAVVAAGTVVTGSGPHAGDEKAKRTGLDPATVAQLHTDLVMLLIGLSVAAWLALKATGQIAQRAAVVLIAIECGQAVIGFVQYFTNLPVLLVGLHMLGACLVWLGALGLHTAVAPPRPAATGAGQMELPAARTPQMV
jgi:cytochrome c oxidase assembly protein subunit 15